MLATLLIVIALPHFLRHVDRFVRDDVEASLSLRALLRAQDFYARTHREKGFAATLAELGQPRANLIDAELASGQKHGYQFTLTPGPPDASGRIVTYTIGARPLKPRPGAISFFADESTVIRSTSENRAASREDFPYWAGHLAPEPGQTGLVGFAPDGESLAAVVGVRVKFFDVATGKEVRSLTTPAEGLSFGFSPDGRPLGWRIQSGKAQLWDLASSRELYALEASEAIQPLAFSPDGRWLAAAGPSIIEVWEVAAAKKHHTFNIEKNFHLTDGEIAFSADGQLLLGGGYEGTVTPEGGWLAKSGAVKLWDIPTGRPVGTLRAPSEMRLARVSPDGRSLATRSDRSYPVQLWEVATGELILTLTHNPARIRVFSLAFSPDGRWLATGGEDHVIKLWDARTGKELRTLYGPRRIPSVGFSPDGRVLVTSALEEVRLWDVATGKQLHSLLGGEQQHFHVQSVAFSPDGRSLAATDDREVRTWEVATGKELGTVSIGGHYRGTLLLYGSDGRLLAISVRERTTRVWDVGTGNELHSLSGFDPPTVVTSVLSPGNRYLATSDRGGTVKIWEVATGRDVATLRGPTVMRPVALSPDGRWVARWAQPFDGSTTVWEVASGQAVGTIGDPLVRPNTSAKHPITLTFNGRWAAVLGESADSGVEVWDVASEQKSYALTERTVVFGPKGRLLATPGTRGLTLRDAVTGKELRPLRLRDFYVSVTETYGPDWTAVTGVAFSPDERWLATSGADGRIRLWDTSTGRVRMVCNLLTGLSEAAAQHREDLEQQPAPARKKKQKKQT